MIIVPDTSVLIDGRVKELVDKTEYRNSRVIIHEAVIAEIENQANMGRESGYKGMGELNNLRRINDKGHIILEFSGSRKEIVQFKEIDEIIRNTAKEKNGILVTSDKIQANIAKIKGIEVIYLKKQKLKRKLKIHKFFDDTTMSVHLRDRIPPMAKKGKPGEIRLVKISEQPSNERELQDISEEILGFARVDPDSFIEIEREGATVVQLGQVRIAIARPPFSDGYEITAVRPITEIKIEDYDLSEKLLSRFKKKAEGILVSGAPGAGKSTFSTALAEFYKSQDKIVKTMESPRDLLVSDGITQYAPLEGDMEKTADILLLVRPDYTIYDEVRKTKDFKIFADMRLSGVGMVGVVHATKGIDAIERLIGRVELGMIPQIVDTVIFIKDGSINKVYNLKFKVKVPTGMVEADLARPVIEVNNFENNKIDYEIYTFGDQTVVMPIKDKKERITSLEKLAGERVSEEIKKIVPKAWTDVSVNNSRATVWVEEKFIPKIIGRGGKNIAKMEKILGISIDIRGFEEKSIKNRNYGKKCRVTIKETINHLHLVIGEKNAGKTMRIYSDDEELFIATISRKGEIKIEKGSDIAKNIVGGLASQNQIYAREENI